MRIAIACNDIRPDSRHGGIAIYTAHLARGLAMRGHQVTILGSDSKTSQESWPEGIEVRFLAPAPCWNPHPKVALVSDLLSRSRAVGQFLAANPKFDVVEFPVWNAEGWHGTRLRGFLSVVRGHTPHVIVNQLTKEAGMKVAKVDRIAAMLERSTARRAGLFLANSESSKATGIDSFGLDRDKVRMCHHGIEVPNLPANLDRSGENVRVLFVGRLEARKGIGQLFEAIPEVLKLRPNTVFEIVGADSPDGAGKSFIASFHQNHSDFVNERVVFHGRLEQPELDALRTRCHFAALPSLYESFGLVHVEAMAFGLPVVAFDISATREVVADGITGILVPMGNSSQLATAILELIENATLRNRMSDSAAQHVREKFAIGAMAECVESAYRDAIVKVSGRGRHP
jgi:glycogen synthase